MWITRGLRTCLRSVSSLKSKTGMVGIVHVMQPDLVFGLLALFLRVPAGTSGAFGIAGLLWTGAWFLLRAVPKDSRKRQGCRDTGVRDSDVF